MANIKPLRVVAAASFIYVLYLIIGHEFIVDKLDEDEKIYEISILTLFVGHLILIVNTYNIVYNYYKMYRIRFEKIADEIEALSVLLYILNLIILINLKLDYSIWGYNIGMMIYITNFVIMIVSILYQAYSFFYPLFRNIGHESNSLTLVTFLIVLIGIYPFVFTCKSYEKFVRRNINNYDLTSEWYNFNFDATLDNIILFKDENRIEGFHRADIKVWEPFEKRIDLLNTFDPSNYYSVLKIYLNDGREIICEDRYDTSDCWHNDNWWKVRISKESNYIKITKHNLIFNNLTDKWKYKRIEIIPE